MRHHSPARGRLPRIAFAGGFVGLVLGLAPAAGQPTQGPPAGQTPPAPKFFIGIAVDGKTDKKEAEDAAKAIAELKGKDGDPGKAGGPVPTCPNVKVKDTKPSSADLAAAAALLPAGVGDQLAAGLALQREEPDALPTLYRWARLAGERELYILGLDATAKSDPERKAIWDGAAKARKDGVVYPHPEVGWQIFSREGAAGQPPEYFVLVQQPEEKLLLTNKELSRVRQEYPPNPDVILLFDDAEAKKKLEAFTEKFARGKDKPERFMLFVVGDRVVQVLTVPEKIITGQMRIGSGLKNQEQEALYRLLDPLAAAKSSSPN